MTQLIKYQFLKKEPYSKNRSTEYYIKYNDDDDEERKK